jgi:hypothetical protein
MSSTRWTRGAGRGFAVALFFVLLASSGCDVQHIQLFRQARQDFFEAASRDNSIALNRLNPDVAQLQTMGQSVGDDLASRPKKPTNEAAEALEQWENVYAEFHALNSRARGKLEEDKLLGTSLTLETLAKGRRDLYQRLLLIEQSPSTLPTTISTTNATADSGTRSTAPPLTDAVSEANRSLERQKDKLFPRDRFLLRALEPHTRYEIAYVKARKAMQRGALGPAQLDYIDQLVGEIARAEKDLETVADDSGDARSSVIHHATLSRFIMLVAGEYLLRDKGGVALPVDPARLKEGGKALGERVKHFRERAQIAGSPEHDLFDRLGLIASGQNLTTWGMKAILQ